MGRPFRERPESSARARIRQPTRRGPGSRFYSLAGETADVGVDAWSPVTDDYDPWNNAFTGTSSR
jgi:hypothetical protein